MQNKDASELQKKWENKSCGNHTFEKEYYLGTATGDYVCTICGYTITRESYKDGSWKEKEDRS